MVVFVLSLVFPRPPAIIKAKGTKAFLWHSFHAQQHIWEVVLDITYWFARIGYHDVTNTIALQQHIEVSSEEELSAIPKADDAGAVHFEMKRQGSTRW